MSSKKFIISVVIVLAVLAGGTYGYKQYVMRQPQYSLKCLAEACQNHDIQEFRKYVAMDDLVSNAVDDLLAVAIADDQKAPKNDMEKLGAALGAGLVQVMKPTLISQAKSNIERSIETGDFKNLQFGEPGSGSISGSDIRDVKIGNVKVEGKVAHVDMSIYSSKEKRTIHLDILMRDMGDHWQITSIGNLKDILAQAKISGN